MANPKITWLDTDREFVTMVGTVHETRERTADITRPRIDGHEYKKRGERAPLSRLVTHRDFQTIATALAGKRDYEAGAGEVATVVDARQQSFSNVVILSVDVDPPMPIGEITGGISGADPAYVVRAVWTVQDSGA